MRKKYFPDEVYGRIPCGLVAFRNNRELELVYANERYYSEFAHGNYETLNVAEQERGLTLGIEEGLKNFSFVEINYKYNIENGTSRRARMSVCKFSEDILLGAVWDVTEQYEILENLQNEQERYSMLMSSTGNIVFENDVVHDTFTLFIPSDDGNMKKIVIENHMQYLKDTAIEPSEQKVLFERLYDENEAMVSARMKLPGDEDWTWYRLSRHFGHDDQGKLVRVFGIISNIEEEKRQEEKIKKQLEIDPVLKIYNRNAAVKIINQYLTENSGRKDHALLVLDIDDFKSVNDTYGHLYGDAVIEMTAENLKNIVGDSGIVGRYGGDEFFVFLRKCSDEEIFGICDKITGGTDTLVKDEHKVSFSIGVALGNSFEKPPKYKEMFDKADRALYYVKKNGKSAWKVYDDALMSENGGAIDYEKEQDSDNLKMLQSMDMMKVFLELSSVARTNDEAVYNILKYVTEKFDFDWIQIMLVNSKEDLITIKYEWCNDSSFRNNSGKSGYYVHSDIVQFQEHFKENPVFVVCPDNAAGFSPKFQREFDKNMKYNVFYNANLTTDGSFYMFVCTRFDKNNPWFEEEYRDINEATKMMAMYISQSDRETENERKLKNMIEHDRKTELYSIMQFYVELGRLRKMAGENNESVTLLHIDIGNFLAFNRLFGYGKGDMVLLDYAREIRYHFDLDHCISTHLDGTDIYYVAFRSPKGDMSFINKFHSINKNFCSMVNEKHNGADIVIRMGAYVLKPNEDGGDGLDYALIAKREKRKTMGNESFYAMYDK